VDVVVASRDLPSGSLVGADDVRTIRWPADAVPAGYSSSVSEVVGRGLLLTVRENEPMLSSKLARPEAGGGMSISIPEGKRALTFRVDDIIGVGGFVRPGHKVDVLVTVGADGGGGQPTTRMVLQNIVVAATGSTVEPNPQGEPETVPNVTFHLDPSQAERLVMAARNGSIQLALRNPLDADTIDTPGIRLNQLLAGVPTPRAALPPRRRPCRSPAPQPPSGECGDLPGAPAEHLPGRHLRGGGSGGGGQ
jgi:pilus assembly protein CpaB